MTQNELNFLDVKEAWDKLQYWIGQYGQLCNDPDCPHGCRSKIAHLKRLSKLYGEAVESYLGRDEQ